MGKAIKLKREPNGKSYSAYIRHPIFKQTRRIRLGANAAIAEQNLKFLNAIFTNPAAWENPPEGNDDIRNQWFGIENLVETSTAEFPTIGEQILQASHDRELRDENTRLKSENRTLRKQLERERGKKLRQGPSPSLQTAVDAWVKKLHGDSDYARNTATDARKFVNQFGPETLVDDMEGRESDIAAWIGGLKTANRIALSAGRRRQIRLVALKFLEDSGALMSRKSVKPPTRKEVRRDRGAIRWLDADQCKAVSEKMTVEFKDVFDIQCGIGLRASEVATLKRADFSPDYGSLTLSPLGGLTLKTGSRAITVSRFPEVQKILKRRAESAQILFNQKGRPYLLRRFFKNYNAALNAARGDIPFKLDARTGRRSCASQLIRAGKSIEAVAALLGDDPNTIREHYGKVMSEEV